MHHEDAGGGGEFDGKVPVRDGVQGVLRRPVEAEQLGGQVAVDGIGGSSQGGGPQGHDVEAAAAVRQALTISFEHLEPGQHVVAEADGLGYLEVSEARHDGFHLALGQIQQGRLETGDGRTQGIDLGAQPQAHVRRHLVVARAPGVELLAGLADVGGEGRFHVHVDVFQGDGPGKITPFDARAHPLQPGNNSVPLGLGQDALARQHGGMGDGALDIVGVEPAVEIDGGGEGLDKGVRGFVETPSPGLEAGMLFGGMVHRGRGSRGQGC